MTKPRRYEDRRGLGRGRALLEIGSEVGGGGFGAQVGEVLAVAGAADVEADGGHGEAIEDGGGDGGVAEILAPGAR